MNGLGPLPRKFVSFQAERKFGDAKIYVAALLKGQCILNRFPLIVENFHSNFLGHCFFSSRVLSHGLYQLITAHYSPITMNF
jgi:hypothetical protein